MVVSGVLENNQALRLHLSVSISEDKCNPNQSAYRPYRSTETALILTLDNILHSADQVPPLFLYPLT